MVKHPGTNTGRENLFEPRTFTFNVGSIFCTITPDEDFIEAYKETLLMYVYYNTEFWLEKPSFEDWKKSINTVEIFNEYGL
jgi:hypothetical protein